MLFEEFNNFRIMRMNATHLEDPSSGLFGDSVGHWEGAALVVDTVAVTTQTVIDSTGIPPQRGPAPRRTFSTHGS